MSRMTSAPLPAGRAPSPRRRNPAPCSRSPRRPRACRQASHLSAEPAVTKTVAPNALAEHDRRGADAGRAAMHEQRLARLQAAALEDVGPDGEEGLGERRRLDHGEAGRDGQGVGLVRPRSIRHSRRRARARRRASPSLKRVAPCAARHDLAGDLQAGDVRTRRAAADSGPARCSTSGRLTPAAATATRISPVAGHAARAASRASAPPVRPAVVMAMAVMVAGRELIFVLAEINSRTL